MIKCGSDQNLTGCGEEFKDVKDLCAHEANCVALWVAQEEKRTEESLTLEIAVTLSDTSNGVNIKLAEYLVKLGITEPIY